MADPRTINHFPLLLARCAAHAVLLFAIMSPSAPAGEASYRSSTISLAGTWNLRLDPEDVGVREAWYRMAFSDSVRLPGSLTENNIGNEISAKTRWTGSIIDSAWFFEDKYDPYRQPGNIKLPFWLTPRKHYVGPAWYQREIEVPAQWKNRSVQLYLERAHWETRVWVDGIPFGLQNSLCTPHEYDFGALPAGRHKLVIRVDNRQKIWVGSDAHSICEHTQTNWNGLIGGLELRAFGTLRISDLQVYPDIQQKSALVRCDVINTSGKSTTATLTLAAHDANASSRIHPISTTVKQIIPTGRSTIEAVLSMGRDARLWDEFDPSYYELKASITARQGKGEITDQKTTAFGIREFRTRGTNFTLNGRVTFLRGTLEACVFPLTGYPPTDTQEWERIFRVARDYGLNHIRFHSWCPPEAAFKAADRLGLILHVETPVWTRLGKDSAIDSFVYAESDRILKEYGNHPSFCMLAVGNEPSGEKQNEFLTTIVSYWKQKDSRRLYTTCSGWPILPVSDFNSTPEPRAHAWGAALKSRFNALPFSTDTDYAAFISQYRVPTVSHEIGQWCAYPDLKETTQYTGILQAKNFEIVRDDLERKQMLDQAEPFLMASGRLQLLEYKEEIEASLRTKGFGGFQLLGLHDFPGQGTALVGLLNPFWRSKGYVTPGEFRKFCSAAVPLVRMKKVVWTANEDFTATAEFANYSATELRDALAAWSLTRPDGTVFASGRLGRQSLPQGSVSPMGQVKMSLRSVTRATKMTFTLTVHGTDYANSWDIWVYPDQLPSLPSGELLIAHAITPEVESALEQGRRVLLLGNPKLVNSNVPAGFSSIFWNTSWTGKQPPHTLGILCDPGHPLFADFPTEYHSTWQWWDLVSKGKALVLDSLPTALRPLVQVIDDWNSNRKLGLLFEANVGKGKLLVCSVDLSADLQARPVARQFLHVLTAYAVSDAFRPQETIGLSSVRRLFRSPNTMDDAKLLKVDGEVRGE